MEKYFAIIFFIISSFDDILGSGVDFMKNGDNFNFQYEKDGGRVKNVGEILLNKNDNYKDYRRDDYRYFDAGNPDIHGEIERPCQAYDSFCIRKFFAEHSHCKISGRRIPDPFYRAQTNFNFASANISAIGDQLEYKGLDKGRIEEFYINKKTDNLVIAINFDNVVLTTNNANLKFHLRGREPEVHQDVGLLIYTKVTVTLVIPGLNDLRLDRAEIDSSSENPLTPFAVGPRIGVSSDPEVEAMFLKFATVGLPIEGLEGLSTQGVFFGANYLQYNICDFGLKVI